ncbi:MAG TPA: hypothetical protein VFP55_04025 [Solirubrobacteraceae bacterium]|nr:hypothetical protein [Solirubrobacteraceae bacterium]
MPIHHFSTPRVTYIGLAYGERDGHERRTAAPRSAASAPRPSAHERVAHRRAGVTRPGAVR